MKTAWPSISCRWFLPGTVSLALTVLCAPLVLGQGLADGLLGAASSVPAQDGSPTADVAAGADGGGDADAAAQAAAEERWYEVKKIADSGNYAEAIEYYTRLIETDEMYVPAYFERGKCLADLGEFELALQSLSTAWLYGRQFPLSYLINLERGKIYLKLGQYREAKDDFDSAVQAKPTDPELLYWRGRTLNRLAQQFGGMGGQETADLYEQARTSLDRAIRLKDDYADAYVERALSRSLLGETDEALEDMIKAAELDPENSQYAARLGLFYLQQADGKRADAERDEKSKQEMVTDYEEGIASLTRFITAEEAVQAAEETAADKSNAGEGAAGGAAEAPLKNYGIDDDERLKLEDAYNQRARARMALANEYPEGARASLYSGVIEDASSLLDLEPNSPLALLQRGMAQRMLGQDDQAASSFGEALKIAPQFSEARIRRGIIYFRAGDYRMALKEFRTAAGSSSDGRAYFWIGAAHAKLGDLADALRAYTKALQQNPNYTPAYNNRALVYLHLGRYEQAVHDLNELLSRDPEDQVARERRELAESRIEAERAAMAVVSSPSF